MKKIVVQYLIVFCLAAAAPFLFGKSSIALLVVYLGSMFLLWFSTSEKKAYLEQLKKEDEAPNEGALNDFRDRHKERQLRWRIAHLLDVLGISLLLEGIYLQFLMD